MIDRFKFRVWDTKKNKWLMPERSFEYFAITFDGEVIRQNSFGCDDFENVIVQQCTGLKDENGKLIYEGDIIKSSSKMFYIVVFNNERIGFLFRFLNDENVFLRPEQAKKWRLTFEVVDNVCEKKGEKVK